MFALFFFSVVLFFSFLLEQSVLLPLGLSPGGFFISFLMFCAAIFILEREWGRWFLLYGSILGGLFSATPFFLFLVFFVVGVIFLFSRPIMPVERAFSFLAVLWLGMALYLVAHALFLVFWRLAGAGDMILVSDLLSFLKHIVFWGAGAFIPFSFVWWLFLRRTHGRQSYALQ
jgi:hypothetical protein